MHRPSPGIVIIDLLPPSIFFVNGNVYEDIKLKSEFRALLLIESSNENILSPYDNIETVTLCINRLL